MAPRALLLAFIADVRMELAMTIGEILCRRGRHKPSEEELTDVRVYHNLRQVTGRFTRRCMRCGTELLGHSESMHFTPRS